MRSLLFFLTLCFLCFGDGVAQNTYEPIDSSPELGPGQLLVRRVQTPITLDGVLDEASWYGGKPADQFWQFFPVDTVSAQGQTEIFMAYDDDFLYVGVKCHSLAASYITPSLRRDYNFSGSDNISILFDPFNDRTNAMLFGMNAYGVRREALIANGGRERSDFASSWDNKWYGESAIHDGYWVAEFAIPFKTLRFKEGSQKWRFNSYRFDTHSNEITTWTQIPRNQIIMDLAFMGEMIWEEPLQKPGGNVSVIPYVIGNAAQDFVDHPGESPDYDINVGGDAKIAITSGLNLDLTVNPDFSQVEVDEQVTNLDRFEIFFPEKRQFFLENADLFSSFGLRRVNPFFSRRIGVSVDTATGQNIQNSILYGARLSGKLNNNLRVGLLNMQTARQLDNGLPSFNYTVAALQQKVFSRSNISFIFVNKDAINGSEYGGEFNSYNRIAGLEYRLASPDNRWTGKAFWHQAITPGDAKDKYTQGVQMQYLRRDYRLEWSHLFVGDGYDAEVGFVPRRDFFILSPEAELYLYPKKGVVNQHTIGFDSRLILKPGRDGDPILPRWGVSDRELEASWEMDFKDNSSGSVGYNYTYAFLLSDFDPTRIQEDSIFLPAGTAYSYSSINARYRSNRSKTFSFQASPILGQFYNGFRAGLEGSFTYRYQPYGFVSLAYTYNHIRLEAPFESANLWLVGPRFDLTFSKKVFLTTFFQYNSQLDNLNINARFQWRFQPVSDFFIVYTDNYFIDPFSQFSVRNRALVAKLTYWLNL